MQSFIKMNNSFSPGSEETLRSETKELEKNTVGKRTRSRLSPLRLDLETGDTNGNTSKWTELDEAKRQSQPRGSLPISESASKFPFYHAYLTEEQEEEAFRDHLTRIGSFLMRDSKSNAHALTFSVVIDPLHLYHFQLVQANHHFEVVGTGKRFPSLNAVLEHYKHNCIPGKNDDSIFLKFPISVNRNNTATSIHSQSSSSATLLTDGLTTPRLTSFKSPLRPLTRSSKVSPSSPHVTSPQDSPDPSLFHNATLPPISEPSQAGEILRSNHQSFDPMKYRAPMPIPKVSEESVMQHIYSEADHPDLDRIKTVLELCKQSDMIHASRKKCTCGLYLEESTLTQGWMMHIDNEPGKTQGRIFFLDTKTNRTTWTLPEDVQVDLKTQFPVKWEFVARRLTVPSKKKSVPDWDQAK